MPTLQSLVDDALDALAGRRFDRRLVRGRVIDTGPQAHRARALADRLNAARAGKPKQPVVLWTDSFAALTLRGPWVYVARDLAERLSDDGLAFVLAHEMAHHDLGHLSPALVVAGLLGHAPRMELMADAEALRICVRAGFSPAGGLETFDDALWSDEPAAPDPLPGWQGRLDRLRRTHPERADRIEALRRLIPGDPG